MRLRRQKIQSGIVRFALSSLVHVSTQKMSRSDGGYGHWRGHGSQGVAECEAGSGSDFGLPADGAGDDAVEDDDDDGGKEEADDGKVEDEPGHVAHVHGTRARVHVCCQYWQ